MLRSVCVLVRMGKGNCVFKPRLHPLSVPLCIWSYYCETCSVFFLCVSVQGYTHTLLVITVSEVREVKNEHTCWTAGRLQPLSTLVKSLRRFYESQPKKRSKKTLVTSIFVFKLHLSITLSP